MKLLFNICCIVLLCSFNVSAENLTQTIKNKEGVPPYSQIYAIETDSIGYVYLATDNGLYIYNGSYIDVYHPDLIGNDKQFIGFYKDGNDIYVFPLNYKLIKILDGTKRTYQPLVYSDNSYSVFAAYKNKRKQLFFLTAEEYNLRSELTLKNKNELIKANKLLSQHNFYENFLKSNVDTNVKNQLIDKIKFAEKLLIDKDDFLCIDNEIHLVKNGKTNLIVNLKKYNIEGTVLRTNFVNEHELSFCVTGKNHGVYILKNDKLDTLYNKESSTGILQDRFQNVWISTLNGKLIKINKFLKKNKSINFSSLTNILHTLIVDTNLIFISDINANLYELNSQSTKIKLIVKANSEYNKQNNLYAFDNHIYFTNNKNIYKFYKNKLIEIEKLPTRQLEHSVRSYKLNNRKIFINNFNMEYEEPNKAKLTLMNTSIRINQIEKDEFENLWIASQSGLYKLTMNSSFSFHKIISNSIIDSTSVNSFVIDGNILYLLCNGTILKYNIKSNNVEYFHKNVLIKSIQKQKNQLLGITQNGYIKLSPQLHEEYTYTLSEDILKEKIVNTSCNKNNLFLFNNTQVIVISNLDINNLQNENSTIVLTKSTYNNRQNKINKTSNSFTETWKKGNTIKLEFDILNNFIYDKNIGSYSLVMSNDTLVKNINLNNNTILLSNLQVGEYKLIITLKNNQQTIFYYNLLPRFYQTTPFLIASFIGIGIFIFLVASWISRKLQLIKFESQLQQSKLLQLESSSRLNQLNPHFIFNALSPLQNYILTADTQKASKYLNKFSNLLRKMLIISRKGTISIHDEILFLEEYLYIQSIEKDHTFEYSFCNTLTDYESTHLFIPTMMIQPLLENAINHGMDIGTNQKGKILITLEKLNISQLKITIFDNGNGFDYAKLEKTKANHATDIIKERLELINKNKKNNTNTLTFSLKENGFESIILLPTTTF